MRSPRQIQQILTYLSQHEIASKGGRAEKKRAAEMEETAKAAERREPSVFGGSAEEPSVVPPGFPEWKTGS